MRVLRLRPGPPLARRLRALRGGVPRPRARGGRLRRHRDLHAVRHPPELDDRGLRALAARREGRGAAAPPARLLADGDPLHGRLAAARRGVRAAAGRRPRLDAGHGRRGAPRRRAPAHLAQQAPSGALGRDHRGRPRRRGAQHGHRHVRPHRGAVGACRAHAGGALASGAHRRLHRVRAAVVHPLPHAPRAHARDRGDLARGQPEAHGGLQARARPDDPEPPGELGEDGPRRGHRSARLGRERPRRHAHGGVHQPARRLLPRREARAGGPDRRGARGGQAGRGARHALRDPEALPGWFAAAWHEGRLQGIGGAVRPGRAARVRAPRGARRARDRRDLGPLPALAPSRRPRPAALTWLGAGRGRHRAGRARHERPHPHPALPPDGRGAVVRHARLPRAGPRLPRRGHRRGDERDARDRRRVPRAQGAPAAARGGDRADPPAVDRGARGLRRALLPDLQGHGLRPPGGARADLRRRVGAAGGEARGPRG